MFTITNGNHMDACVHIYGNVILVKSVLRALLTLICPA